tara:strand:+ start:571 stop:840 length:270 start_codon:yes stop_codon:yes gene_type:complete
MLKNRRRNVYLSEMKRLIMQNMPETFTDVQTITKNDLFENCNHDALSLQIKMDYDTFNIALSSLVDEQCIVYFSDKDIRPTRCGLIGYN